jgi:hypothetical protein
LNKLLHYVYIISYTKNSITNKRTREQYNHKLFSISNLKSFHKIDLKNYPLINIYPTHLTAIIMSTYSKNSTANSLANTTTKKVIEFAEWNPKLVKYMAPKVNEKGGKSITLISKQTNRALHLNTPLMMTWGIADFCDDQGNSDGKYKISINFPNEEYKTPDTDILLKKMIEFQEQVLDDAVENSELWWGEKMSRELVKHTFFPFLKYRKNKDTKKYDYTSAPSIQAKVPFYDGKRWDVELYDTNYNLIFPCENDELTPVDFIQCSGLWIGGKGWGLTWKLIQCIVKPKESESIRGICQIKLSDGDKQNMEKEIPAEDFDYDEEPETTSDPEPVKQKQPISTIVDNSDDESEPPAKKPAPAQVPAPAPAQVPAQVPATPEKVKTEVPAPDAPKKKVVVKKKVVA